MEAPTADTSLGRMRAFLCAHASVLPWLAVALAWLFGLWLVLRTPVFWRDQDFLFTVNRAYHLAWKSDMLADGYYPVGYPLLVRILAQALGGSYLLAGKAINLAAYAVALVAVVLVGRRMGLTPAGQAISVLAIAAVPAVMIVVVQARCDLPGAALVMLSVAMLFAGGRRSGLWAGLAAGLAYEFRYQALVVAVVCMIYLLAVRRWRPAAQFALGFLIFAAPQLALSWHFRGTPFYYSTIATNIAFGVWGEGNVIKNLPRVRDTPAGEILRAWPLVLRHWAGTFLKSFSLLGSGALWAAAAAAGLLSARQPGARSPLGRLGAGSDRAVSRASPQGESTSGACPPQAGRRAQKGPGRATRLPVPATAVGARHALPLLALTLAALWIGMITIAHLQTRYFAPPAILLAPGIGALMEAVGRGRLAPPRGIPARLGRRALQAACAILIIASYVWAPNDLAAYPAEAAEIEHTRAALNRLPGASQATVVCLGRTYYLSPRLPLPLPQLFVELTRQGDFGWADVERLLTRDRARYIVTHADDVRALMPPPMARKLIGPRRIALDGIALTRVRHCGKTSIWCVGEP